MWRCLLPTVGPNLINLRKARESARPSAGQGRRRVRAVAVIRSTERMTGTHRDTICRLPSQIRTLPCAWRERRPLLRLSRASRVPAHGKPSPLPMPWRRAPQNAGASQEGATPKPRAVAGPMWRPRNAGVRGGTMSSNLLCSSGESRANRGFDRPILPAEAPPWAARHS